MKTEVVEKEEDLKEIVDEKLHIYTAEGGAQSELGERVQKIENRWAELKHKVDARIQQFNEGLSNWNVFQGMCPNLITTLSNLGRNTKISISI